MPADQKDVPVELEPVALEPATRRERRRAGSPLPQFQGKVSQHRRGRRFGAFIAAVLLAVAAAGRLTGTGPAASLHPDEPDLPVTFTESSGAPGNAPPPSLKPLSPGWRLVRRSPIASRHGALATWTGRELLIWGGVAGGKPVADGAAYRPDTDQWHPLPASPLEAREGAASAWTGREWIIWGGVVAGEYSGEGAAYNPGTAAWRVLPPAPIGPRSGSQIVWTGRELLAWGGGGSGAGGDAAYDPERNQWRRLPRGGPADAVSGAVWTGTEMIVWGFTGSAAFDPVANRWRDLPEPPFSPWFTQNLVWTGTELIAVGGSTATGRILSGAAYDPVTDRWRTLATPPDPFDVSDATTTWTGRLLVVARGPSRVQVYDPAGDTWAVMPGLATGPRIGCVAVWTGDEVVFWGGFGVLGTAAVLEEGVAWRP